ncbi:MAG: PAS domain-containing protein [Methyloligellaceae bacterium]
MANEAPFELSELFFSRTDLGGRILSGNSVFQRVSQYSEIELTHQPHNIIRHHDMPKAVFRLLWDTIKRGEPIGAYVKNKAKDGCFYWVFAIVTPVENGYLSVRLKPTSTLLTTIQQEYKSLLEYERQPGVTPSESAKVLLSRLNELGFDDYQSFMACALYEEISARESGLRLQPDQSINELSSLLESSKILMAKSGVISHSYAENQYVPLNLSVKAAQLGQVAATIGVISTNYSVLSDEIRLRMSEFMDSAQGVYKTVCQGLFLACTAKMQSEMLEFFKGENCFGETSEEQENSLLTKQKDAYQTKAVKGLTEIAKQAQTFYKSCSEMKRLAAGLGVTRVMGKIETSFLQTADASLDDLMDNLMHFQNSIELNLKEIEGINRHIEKQIAILLRIL